MRFHILHRPIKPGTRPNTAIWECECGINVCLPVRQGTVRGTVIRVPDEQGEAVVECAGCYNGTDASRSQQNQATVDNPTVPEEVNAPDEVRLLDREGETVTLREDGHEEVDAPDQGGANPFESDGEPIAPDEVEDFGTGRE